MPELWKGIRRFKILVMVIVIGLGLMMAWLIIGYKARAKDMNPKDTGVVKEKIAVRLFSVEKRPFRDYLEAMGTIKGNNEIDLRFAAAGYLARINFKEGEWIEKDEAIAELDSAEADLRLRKAKLEFENACKLYELGAIARDRCEEMRLNLALAEEEKKKYCIFSPWRGILGEIEKETGEFITLQDKIAAFIEAGSVNMEIGIIEKDIKKIAQGQVAEIRVDTYPQKIFEGRVSTIIPLITSSNRTMQVRLKIGNSQGELLPGMFARARILIYEKPGALVIPASSLFQEGENFFVFKVTGARLSKTPVVLNYLQEDYAEVIAGLEAGETVALKVIGELADGREVEIIDEEAADESR